MLNAEQKRLCVVSLKIADAVDDSFESELQDAGHEITVFTELEPVLPFIESSPPDIVIFDPISRFGMAGSMQRLRDNFDGLIVAIGNNPGDIITELLPHFGITDFAKNPEDLLAIIGDIQGLKPAEPEADSIQPEPPVQPEAPVEIQLSAQSEAVLQPQPSEAPISKPETSRAPTPVKPAKKSRSWIRSFSIPGLKRPESKRWHKKAAGAVVMVAVIVALIIPFTRPIPTPEPVAKALPVVPRLLTEPLAPLTVAELSGDVLPLEISGIADRAVIEAAAVAFWGDTAPDAFVTVNGQPIDVSDYGAFVVDIPLEDGANFIEVLASDFQGRTTRRSYTIVSLQ